MACPTSAAPLRHTRHEEGDPDNDTCRGESSRNSRNGAGGTGVARSWLGTRNSGTMIAPDARLPDRGDPAPAGARQGSNTFPLGVDNVVELYWVGWRVGGVRLVREGAAGGRMTCRLACRVVPCSDLSPITRRTGCRPLLWLPSAAMIGHAAASGERRRLCLRIFGNGAGSDVSTTSMTRPTLTSRD